MNFIHPGGMEFTEWSPRMNLVLGLLDSPDTDDWREWARVINSNTAVAGFNPPRPDSYDEWDAWADDFIRCVG